MDVINRHWEPVTHYTQHRKGAERRTRETMNIQRTAAVFFFSNKLLLSDKFIFIGKNGAGCGANTCVAWWLINVVCGLE